jgi:hypothetical protein
MTEAQQLIESLTKAGWTYAAIADKTGTHWHTVRRWHNGESRVNKVAVIGLRTLLEETPPPRRRYRPDTPRRKTNLASPPDNDSI